MKAALLMLTHAVALAAGFALGIYMLPILTAPESPDEQAMRAVESAAVYSGTFSRERAGSDLFHWGEGEVSLGRERISHRGALAPGPDYRLYLSPVFVESEDEFLAHQARMMQVGEVKGFNGFILNVPAGVDIDRYNTAVIWCERFSEFISSAQYRP